MTQRKTQTARYWQEEFAVSAKDIEAFYNHILEQNRPIDLNDLAISLVRRHCDAEERASRSELQKGKLYQPEESYAVGDALVFPAMDFATGAVTASRAGQHPEYGAFTVIKVEFDNGNHSREFAADFKHEHPLNIGDEQSLANLQGLQSPDELFNSYQSSIRTKIKTALDKNDEFVEFHDQYFLLGLLPEFHEGMFNIADAAIDINQGPLSVAALIEQMGLADSDEENTEVARFLVSYHLAHDERFDDVGPSGQILWYLDRMEPPEAHRLPRRLQSSGDQTYDSSQFDSDLKALLAEIDDEFTKKEDIEPLQIRGNLVTVVLNYPHWRVGTLPLTPKTRSFFPLSDYNPVRFDFVDGNTGDTFPGWAVQEHDYVYGLDKWYQENNLPVGAYVIIKQTEDPLRVIVEYQSTRTQRDWVRMVATSGTKLIFQMNPTALNCQYDELMLISDPSPTETDLAWVRAEERNQSVYETLCFIFPELSKLNPQSTVHAKTLYSAVNVVRRVAPGIIFRELISRRCFIPMNHGYWTYDPALRD